MLNALSSHVLMHLAAIIAVAALALRDQLRLRSVLLVSILLSAIYNIDERPDSDWQSLFWNVVSFVINLVVIVQIVLDRTHIGLSAEEQELFAAFDILTPGEFRALLKLAAWYTAGDEEMLTQEGVAPKFLYYVLTGGVRIEKSGRSIVLDPRTFIGEIAFLHRRPASATVRLAAGSRYVAWPVESLDRRIQGRNALKHAVVRLISFDMAHKVARS